MREIHWKKLVGAASAAVLAATQVAPAITAYAEDAATTDYIYCYASMTWAEYWQNEGVYLDSAANGNWEASSADVDSHEETDLGAYDAVTRATSNHGLHRGSYQCVVKVYDTDGNSYDYTGKGQGESVDVVSDRDADTTTIMVDGKAAGAYDHSVITGPKYVPVAVPAADYEEFKKAYTVYENGDEIKSGFSEKNLVNIDETVKVDANTSGIKVAEKQEDGTFQFSKRETAATADGKVVDKDAVEISEVQRDSGYGDFIRVDINGDYGDLGAHMYAVRWDYYGDGDTVLATYGTKFAADNWMHKAMGIQLGLTKSDRCQLPEGTDGYGRWDVTIYATDYQDFTFTVDNEPEKYVYGTMNLPYADYYYGELNDVKEDATMDLETADPAASLRAEGCYDAVTSATNTKSKRYDTTYFTENEDGSVTVEGIKDVAIAVPEKLYNEAKTAIEEGKTCNNQLLNIVGNMTVNEDQTVVPTEYKMLNGDGTLSAMVDSNEAITVTDATVTASTNTRYGNYQLSITEKDSENSVLPTAENMEGAIVTMTDGSKYAMLHVDNLWLRTGEMAWATTDNFVVHSVNTLKYKNFEDTVGKTVASVRYIVRDGADVTFTADAYLPLMHSGTATVEATPVSAGKIAVTVADLPEEYDATASIAGIETTYADGVLTYDPTTVQPGSYNITVSDTKGVYAPITVSVVLTTEDMPAAFDAENKTLIAAENADEATFANYLSKLSKATVNGTEYTLSGRGSTKIFDTKTGALNVDAAKGDTPVFAESGTYEITVEATGYTTPLTFEVNITVTDERGDVNLDGNVNAFDVAYILQYAANISVGNDDFKLSDDAATNTKMLAAADINGDGTVNAFDAAYALRYSASVGAGIDITWDEILK